MKQRPRLASVSPTLLEIYADDGIVMLSLRRRIAVSWRIHTKRMGDIKSAYRR
jgi:hypothetical protein